MKKSYFYLSCIICLLLGFSYVQNIKLYEPIKNDKLTLAKKNTIKFSQYLLGLDSIKLEASFTSNSNYLDFKNLLQLNSKNSKNLLKASRVGINSIEVENFNSDSSEIYTSFILEYRKTKNSSIRSKIKLRSLFDSYSETYLFNGIEAENINELLNYNFVTPIDGDKIENYLGSECSEIVEGSRFSFHDLTINSSFSNNREPYDNEDFSDIVYKISEDDFYNTEIFEQIKFNKLIDDKKAPEPGMVLSIKDLREAELKYEDGSDPRLFYQIDDISAAFDLKNGNGGLVNHPIAFCLDATWNRILAFDSKLLTIEVIKGFKNIRSCFFQNSTLYVVDENSLHVYSVIFKNEKLLISKKEEHNLLDKIGFEVKDVTGYKSDSGESLILSLNGDNGIITLPVDGQNGELKFSDTNRYTTYIDNNGNEFKIYELNKIESVNIGSGAINLIGIDQLNNLVITYRIIDGKITILNGVYFPEPFRSYLSNVGYNKADNTFFITDFGSSKIHVFDQFGDYLGSGGNFGRSESDNQLFFPNALSSNTFNNKLNEIIVANRWGYNTGFKRLKAIAGISQLRITEKAPRYKEDADLDELIIKFNLSAAAEVSSVELKLNDFILDLEDNNFAAGSYSYSFLTTSLDDYLINGWNDLKVTVNSEIINSGGDKTNKKTSKEVSFYYYKSIYEDDFVISNNASSDIIHAIDNPFVIYKNIFVGNNNDSTSFEISKGKLEFLPNSIISIGQNVNFLMDEEIVELSCMSGFDIQSSKSATKEIMSSTFDGQYLSGNILKVTGTTTGGEGSGTANSNFEITETKFLNYSGYAIELSASRMSLINNSFEILDSLEFKENSFSSALYLSNDSRIDVRGTTFENNDIGIDGTYSQLFVGHPSQSNNDVKTLENIFVKNKISINLNNCITELKNTKFISNEYAILDLNGQIKLDKNAKNIFEENHVAIAFSNIIQGQRGLNQFINNETDVLFIDPGSFDSKPTIDLSCNYWENEADKPIISTYMFSENNLDIFLEPRAEKKINGNDKEIFICNGSSNSNQSNNGSNLSKKNNKRYEKIKDKNYTELLNEIDFDENQNQLGKYTSSLDLEIINSSNKNIVLNLLISQFDDKTEVINKGLLSSLFYGYEKNDLKNPRELIIKDRLEFIDYLTQGSVLNVQPSQKEKEGFLSIYPNPSTTEVYIKYNWLLGKSYSMRILNVNGELVGKPFTAKKSLENYGPLRIDLGKYEQCGLLIFQLFEDENLVQSKKIIKK